VCKGLQADPQGHRKRSTKAARSRAFHLGRTPAGRDPRQEAAGCPNVVWGSRPYKRLPTAPALDLSKDPRDTIHTRNKINPTPPAHNEQPPGQPTKPCGSDKSINTLRAPRFAPQQPHPLIASPPAPLAPPRISLSLSLSPMVHDKQRTGLDLPLTFFAAVAAAARFTWSSSLRLRFLRTLSGTVPLATILSSSRSAAGTLQPTPTDFSSNPSSVLTRPHLSRSLEE